jgi:glutamate-1-semialdehyde 2,1-aminomutase
MDSLQRAIADARERYAEANPLSRDADREAEAYLPGGNTRTVLHYEPFPLTMVSGDGAEMVDLDGHRYVDFVGEYSAGLFGHKEPVINAAIHEALDRGVAMGAPTEYERKLARLICERFPSVDRVRFCNSGTEANIWALTTARKLTGRTTFMAFDGAYHGGVLKFPGGHCSLNVPFDFVLSEYNDSEAAAELIRQTGERLAAVIVEPILGAGGNIQGNREFLETLREETREVGALLIFDEVKTSRISAGGVQAVTGIHPDLTTLGKFIGGGLTTGAFGGSAEVMAHFNPKRPGNWNHAGTFNNNVCSMAAGYAGLSQIFTAERATEFQDWSEAHRERINAMFVAKGVPMYCNGYGSIFAVHFSPEAVKRVSHISKGCQAMRPLLHVEMLLQGVLICSRGDLFLSLPMTDQHLEKARDALGVFVDRYKPLIIEVLNTY